jgi:hypothetical protein
MHVYTRVFAPVNVAYVCGCVFFFLRGDVYMVMLLFMYDFPFQAYGESVLRLDRGWWVESRHIVGSRSLNSHLD